MEQSRFDGLVRAIYGTAIEPERWRQTLKDLGDAVGGVRMTVLLFCDPQDGAPLFSRSSLGSREGIYFPVFAALDPHPKILAGSNGRIIPVYETDQARRIAQSEFYTRFLVPNGLGWMLGTHLRPSAMSSVFFGMHRELGRPPFTVDEIRAVERLCGHIGEALRIEESVGLQRDPALMQAMDRLEFAVAIIRDSGRRVVLGNRALREFVDRHDGLSLEGQRLSATESRADGENLERAITLALSALPGMTQPMGGRIGRSTSRHPYLFLAEPLGSDQDDRSALVLISDPDAPGTAVDPIQIAHIFGLTRAEAEITAALVVGGRVEDIAKKRNVRPDTVRGQIKSALQKAGVNRQGELVQLISSRPRVNPGRS